MAKETALEREPAREQRVREDEEPWFRCAQCGHGLAPERARIEVDGAHEHVFTNPAGVTFTVRCFREAPGTAGVGDESTFWSWFRGYAWRIAACARCGAHAGWSFRGEASAFWGLVASRGSP